ncbi:putative AbiEii toxin of type IV toxin-antitoxin system [Pseudomonas helmanticensis]|uniref:Putative AbiEii toxin of type IV toxin-antitoxin system n=1 Tax=Pseudomonas helmanticensis TaxID=1471381 RepID=A0A4R7VUQ8_9PSED|nr:ATP-binding protein [Pseudomonas helmanticensis]TDV53149.1 putative AbiEii toxin of type IV toxin-antitoxin system [Pseudomonas helmanticensis]
MVILVNAVQFETWGGNTKRVQLIHPESTKSARRFETTIITGQNGSHKSTLLKQLVSDLTLLKPPLDGGAAAQRSPPQVICISGSLADRFPQKELPGGARTSFDVPNYTYFGQRIYSNLLSKKAPVETMLSFALSPSRSERYSWEFYSEAHKHAGIELSVEYSLNLRIDKRNGLGDLLNAVRAKTPESDSDRASARSLPHVSYKVAQWLLKEFSEDDFFTLQKLVTNGKRQINLTIDTSGPRCETVDTNVLRLGLLTDLIVLIDATVVGALSKTKFSMFELSSGEYHMFTTILGIGFGLADSAVVLIDEPENNLHPQWQRALMTAVFDVCGRALETGHLIVSTHSPLIVGAALEGSTIVDLTTEEPQLSIVNYGASSDELLLTQFGVGSSRNRLVVDTVQRAIYLIERGNFNNSEFESLIPKLTAIREALTDDDPMIEVINALLDEETV